MYQPGLEGRLESAGHKLLGIQAVSLEWLRDIVNPLVVSEANRNGSIWRETRAIAFPSEIRLNMVVQEAVGQVTGRECQCQYPPLDQGPNRPPYRQKRWV